MSQGKSKPSQTQSVCNFALTFDKPVSKAISITLQVCGEITQLIDQQLEQLLMSTIWYWAPEDLMQANLDLFI